MVAFPWVRSFPSKAVSFLFLFFPRHTHTHKAVCRSCRQGWRCVEEVVVAVEESEPRELKVVKPTGDG